MTDALVEIYVSGACQLIRDVQLYQSLNGNGNFHKLLSDNDYHLIQASFGELQSYSWGFVLIQSLSKLLPEYCLSVKQIVYIHSLQWHMFVGCLAL